jgi:hypothetical protein
MPPAKDYIITKLRTGPYETEAKFPKSETNFVIAILGLPDTELDARHKDIKALIETVRIGAPKPVTLVLYDEKIKLSRRFNYNVDGFGDITIVAVQPTEHAQMPGLDDAMEASYKLSHENGKQVDYALSDLSSPAWRFNVRLHIDFIPYIKLGGKVFLHSPQVDDSLHWMLQGDQYDVGDPTRFSYSYGEKPKRPATLSVEETHTSSPLPHFARGWFARYTDQTIESEACDQTSIRNTDGSCAFVAVYHILRKTRIWLLVNEELRDIILTALQKQQHDLKGTYCPLPPHPIRTAYKGLTGVDVNEAEGLRLRPFVRAIVACSPNMQMAFPEPVMVGSDTQGNFNFGMHQMLQACDKIPEWGWPTCAIAATNGPHQVQLLTAYLTNAAPDKIVAGIIAMRIGKDDKHSVAFVKCKTDVHFLNWGEMKTGAELETKRDSLLLFFAGGKTFIIESLSFLCEPEELPRKRLKTTFVDQTHA